MVVRGRATKNSSISGTLPTSRPAATLLMRSTSPRGSGREPRLAANGIHTREKVQSTRYATKSSMKLMLTLRMAAPTTSSNPSKQHLQLVARSLGGEQFGARQHHGGAEQTAEGAAGGRDDDGEGDAQQREHVEGPPGQRVAPDRVLVSARDQHDDQQHGEDRRDEQRRREESDGRDEVGDAQAQPVCTHQPAHPQPRLIIRRPGRAPGRAAGGHGATPREPARAVACRATAGPRGVRCRCASNARPVSWLMRSSRLGPGTLSRPSTAGGRPGRRTP